MNIQTALERIIKHFSINDLDVTELHLDIKFTDGSELIANKDGGMEIKSHYIQHIELI